MCNALLLGPVFVHLKHAHVCNSCSQSMIENMTPAERQRLSSSIQSSLAGDGRILDI